MSMEDADAKAGLPERSAQAVIDLLDSWIEEDSRLDNGVQAWERLKRALDSVTVRWPAALSREQLMPKVTFDVPEGALSALRLSPT